MTRSIFRPLALAASVLALAAAPALAVSIKHTNRADGDPEAALVPRGHAAPPADTTGPRYFDKSHQGDAAR